MDIQRWQHISAMVSLHRISILQTNMEILLPDPREYCISTKDFVVDGEGKLKGLNTGTSATGSSILCTYIPYSSCRMDQGQRGSLEDGGGSRLSEILPCPIGLLSPRFLGTSE